LNLIGNYHGKETEKKSLHPALNSDNFREGIKQGAQLESSLCLNTNKSKPSIIFVIKARGNHE